MPMGLESVSDFPSFGGGGGAGGSKVVISRGFLWEKVSVWFQ